jgi:hypothetical protein
MMTEYEWHTCTDVAVMIQHLKETTGTAKYEMQMWFGLYKVPHRKLVPRALRCIVGNPFRPIVFNNEWRSESVIGLAKRIRDESCFELMGILHDALADAGYHDEIMLSHCLGEDIGYCYTQKGSVGFINKAYHTYGCHVLRLILDNY